MTTIRILLSQIGGFNAGRSVPLPPCGRPIYWLTLPLVEVGVTRWGFHLYVGPKCGFLAFEASLTRRPLHLEFNTIGWRDW